MSNDRVDPAFLPALEAMFGSPRKVAAELREYDRLVELAEAHHAVFDEWDDAMMHDLLGSDLLAKPVQDLLIAISQIDLTKDSFGLDAEKTVQFLVPKIKALRDALIEKWRDQ